MRPRPLPEPGDDGLDLVDAGVHELAGRSARPGREVVVNCAGATRGDAAALVRANVVVVANLVAALERAAPGARLVHLGSSAEYGAVLEGVPIAETAAPAPIAAYGLTKLAATELIRSGPAAVAARATVLRVFNPIGPGQPANTLAAAAARAFAGSPSGPVRLGRLDDWRDFVDVADVAAAVVAVALAGEPVAGRILNVGSGRATQARELVGLIARVAGYDGPIEEVATAGSDRSPAVPWQQADIAAIGTAVGWRPRRDLAASVRALWESLPLSSAGRG